MPLAGAAALRSVELDDSLAEGHSSLALVHLMYDWDWPGAEKEFQKAIALNPSYALAHHGYAVLLMTVGRLDEAGAEARRALTVDPLSVPINSILAIALSTAGQHDQAIQQFRRTLELSPNYPPAHSGLGLEYERRGQHDEALRERLTANTLEGAPPAEIDLLRDAYRSGGWKGYQRRSLEQALDRYDGWHWDAYGIAQLHAALGHKDEALTWLERVYEARSGAVVWFPTDDILNTNLKDEPRYQELLRNVRLRIVSSR
jgi:tetratricopeptide (TPR) repeat protein